MDENYQDEADRKSILAENVRWVFNKRSKLWVPQHKKRKWFRRWKTFEDNVPFNWLNLIVALAIPFVVTFLGLYATQQITQQQALLNEKQHQIDLQIAQDQQQEATLKSYLDDISDLLLNHNLHNAKPTDEVTQVARERTLTALRRLNAVRNKILVQFLRDVQLINRVIDLRAADLSDDDLSSVNLDTVNLNYANLSGAYLIDADLLGARVTQAQLANARSIQGTIMPNGSIHP